ncbi:MAG: hypothetical protein ACLURV_09890 [Gallintestinimicrobium sp.]
MMTSGCGPRLNGWRRPAGTGPLFTCHQREAQMLTANQMVYNYIEL